MSADLDSSSPTAEVPSDPASAPHGQPADPQRLARRRGRRRRAGSTGAHARSAKPVARPAPVMAGSRMPSESVVADGATPSAAAAADNRASREIAVRLARRRTRSRLVVLGDLLAAAGVLAALLAAAGVVLIALDAGAVSGVVAGVREVADTVVGPFHGLVALDPPKTQGIVNAAIAAAGYLVGGLTVRSLLRS